MADEHAGLDPGLDDAAGVGFGFLGSVLGDDAPGGALVGGRMAEGATMTLDLDIYRSANLLVKQHGEDELRCQAFNALAGCKAVFLRSC